MTRCCDISGLIYILDTAASHQIGGAGRRGSIHPALLKQMIDFLTAGCGRANLHRLNFSQYPSDRRRSVGEMAQVCLIPEKKGAIHK